MFNVKNAKKPVVRREFQEVKAAPQQQKQKAPVRRHPGLSTPAQAIARDNNKKATSAAASNGHTNGVGAAKGRDAVPSASRKRQRNGRPVDAVDWGTEDGSESDAGSDVLNEGKRKRVRDSASLEPDETRSIWTAGAVVTPEDVEGLIHGADMTSGKLADMTALTPDKYKDIFARAPDGAVPTVELQYPSNSPPERFELVWPKDGNDFNPFNEIHDAVASILTHYLPPDRSAPYLDESTGIPRRFQIAVNKQSLPAFTAALDEFNALIRARLADGTIERHLSTLRQVPLPLVERILERQCYDRTVAPRAERLTVRKDLLPSKSNTYGEMRPRFTHDVFRETRLRAGDVFVDLGSGVGNVALQAALEIGCESWGIEMMHVPAACAARQQAELERRCRLFSIRPGRATLLRGDMLASPAIDRALERADVVLVNNKVFEAPLNASIALKFLDLKDGARIVSLQPFVRGKVKITENNMHDPALLLRLVAEKHYGSNRVSWSDAPGEWYLSVKDSAAIRAFTKSRRAGR